ARMKSMDALSELTAMAMCSTRLTFMVPSFHVRLRTRCCHGACEASSARSARVVARRLTCGARRRTIPDDMKVSYFETARYTPPHAPPPPGPRPPPAHDPRARPDALPGTTRRR